MAESLRGLLPSLAVFAAVLLVVLAPGSQAFKAAGPAHSSALVLRVARGEAAWEKRVAVSGLTLQGNLPRLYLRGGGDEDVEAEEDGGEEEAKEGDQGEDEGEDGKIDDPDAGPMTITKAIKEVLYHARIHNGVSKGIKEVCQALERGEAQLVILAEDCDHEDYVKLVTALTAEKGVYLIKVPEKAKLGDWAGQHKLDADANVKKTCPSSCVAIKDFGEQSEGLAFLLQFIKAQQADEAGPAAIEGEEEEAAEDEGGGEEEAVDEEEPAGEGEEEADL